MKNLLYIAAIVMLVASCKKEPIPPVPENTGPFYTISGYINGEFKQFEVGQSGVLISHGTDFENGTEYYYGQIVSTSEDFLIRIDIAKPELLYNSQGFVPLNEGPREFMIHDSGCKNFDFGANQTQSNFLLIKEGNDFVPTDEVAFDKYGSQDVTFKFTDVGQNSFVIPVKYGFDSQWLDASFSTWPNADSVIFSGNGGTTATHEWYIDQSMVSTEQNFSIALPIGIHVVEHQIRDQHGNESRETTLLRITDYVLDWQMGINNCTGTLPASNYGNVIITVLTDGVEYKSSFNSVISSNSFVMSDVEYVGSASGTPTRAVFDFLFSAELSNEAQTESLSLSEMSGTFNVGL